MTPKNRIKELRHVAPQELEPCPHNWRRHPDHQRLALREMMGSVGVCDAAIAWERADGRLQLIDGHLRREELERSKSTIPVLVLDVNEQEADLLLATLDPLAGLATPDGAALEALLASLTPPGDAVAQLLADLRAGEQSVEELLETLPENKPDRVPLTLKPAILIECTDEAQQRALLERLNGEGLTVRALQV